jgi:hypothetical protein
VKRVLASYRWRRRLVWLAVTAAVVAGVVAIGVRWSNTAPHEAVAPKGPLKLDYSPPKAVRLKLHDKALALAVVTRFIDTAVARKNVDRAWGLVSRDFRAGVSRKEWDQGNLPVPPYPVATARWRLQFSDAQGVGFTVALFPVKGSQQQAQVFMIGLHHLDSGGHRRWLVDNWQSAPTSPAISGGSQSDGSPGGTFASVSPKLGPDVGKARESAIWLLIPVGLLSLIVLVPAGIAGVNWYRGYRARALLGP